MKTQEPYSEHFKRNWLYIISFWTVCLVIGILIGLLILDRVAGAGTAKIDWNESECAKEWKAYHDHENGKVTLEYVSPPDCPHPVAKHTIDGRCPVCNSEMKYRWLTVGLKGDTFEWGGYLCENCGAMFYVKEASE